jgi:hypothetical protein
MIIENVKPDLFIHSALQTFSYTWWLRTPGIYVRVPNKKMQVCIAQWWKRHLITDTNKLCLDGMVFIWYRRKQEQEKLV